MSLSALADPFAFHRRLAAHRHSLERAAWDANPDLQRTLQGVEHLALPNGEWALVDLTDRELQQVASPQAAVSACVDVVFGAHGAQVAA